jgi:hypothetical protein
MDELSYVEKMKWPYTLLLDPVTGRAAVYDGMHLLIAETASEALLAYGLANVTKRVPWDWSMRRGAPDKHALPAWATEEVLDRAELLWIRMGGLTDAQWRAIPPR